MLNGVSRALEKGQATVTTWNEPHIKIITKINAPEVNLKTLEAIVEKGRYQIEFNFHEEERFMLLDMPQTEKTIFVNGFDFNEYLEFDIYIPKQVRYQLINPLLPTFL